MAQIRHSTTQYDLLELMYAALIHASETWKRIAISEFELRQLESLREQLNRHRAERTAPRREERIPLTNLQQPSASMLKRLTMTGERLHVNFMTNASAQRSKTHLFRSYIDGMELSNLRSFLRSIAAWLKEAW